MVKHIILWNLKETYSDGEKNEIRKNIIRERYRGLLTSACRQSAFPPPPLT